jgi:hypothetical protein
MRSSSREITSYNSPTSHQLSFLLSFPKVGLSQTLLFFFVFLPMQITAKNDSGRGGGPKSKVKKFFSPVQDLVSRA